MSHTSSQPQGSDMMPFMQRLVEPSVFLPKEQRRQSTLLMILLLSLIGLGGIYQFLFAWLSQSLSGTLETIAAMVVMMIAYFLCRRGYWKLGAALTVSLLYIATVIVVATSYTPQDDTDFLVFLVVPLLISSIFFSNVTVGAISVLFSLGVISLAWFLPSISLTGLFVNTLPFFWIVTAVIQISTKHRNAVEAERRAELASSEARFRALFDNVPMSGVICKVIRDAQNEIVDWEIQEINGLGAADIGQSPSELIGKRFLTLFGAEMMKPYLEICRSVAASNQPQHFEIHFDHSDKHYLSSVFAIDADHYANVSVNITERKQVEDALRESDEKYRAFIEQTSEAITFVDEQGNITEWNHARETLTGWKLEAVIGKPYWEIRLKLLPPEMRTPEYAQRLKSTTLEMLQTGQSKFFNRVSEGELFTATGERRIVEQISFPIKTRKGYRVTSIMRDITERKRAEDELRRSEEKYRGLLESMDNVIATVNDEGKFLYMNDKAAEQLGGNVQELTGKTMLELFPEPFASRQLANIQKVISEDKAIISENQSFFKGIPRWQHTTIQPIHDEHGRVIYALVNATDIHDIKETQEKLLELNRTLEDRVRERTAQVRDLYDNAPAGYHSLDKDGTIVMINQTELMWLGYTHEEIIGVKKFRDLLTPQSQQSFDEKFPRFIEQGRAKDIEFEIVRKNGDILPIILSATALYDSNGKFLQSRTTMFDITERRQAEVALRESRDALSIANLALEKAARMKDEFLASMSHELRTPLTGILGLSEALQLNTYGELTAKQQRTIKAIEDSGRHLLELINDILDLSKIEAGKVELDILPCSLADICQSSLQLTKGMAQKKQIHVEYVPLGEPVMIRADARRVKQILVNLLSNAVKFTQENGQMGLEVQKDEAGQKIRLIVWDKGIGIKPEDQHKLFKPFTQIDSSLAREYAGTGLGLSLVRRLTELHHGSVEVESVFGEGSRFIVTLPWSPQASSIIPKSAQANIGRQSNPALTPGTSQSLVLIVDDNETVLQMIADFLTVNHYHVMTAQSGTEMLEMAAEHHPNLIMVDIQMPGMDGLDAIRRLRTHPDPVAAAVPVLAVTALAMAGDRERCLAAGANDYMSKPVKLVHLIETIKKLIYAF